MSMFRQDRSGATAGAPPWKGVRAASHTAPEALRTDLADHLAEVLAQQHREVDRRFVHSLMDTLDDPELGLPHFPDTPLLLDEVHAEAEPAQRDVLRVVERDPELVREVWQAASIPRYGTAPADLGQAVTRVGLDEVWRLGVQGALGSLLFEVPGLQGELGALRRRAPIGATLAAWLARQPRGAPYLAGVLREVGTLLIYRGTHALSRTERVDRELVEHMVRRTSASWSGLATATWGLDDEVVTAVALHPQPLGERPSRLPAVVRAADVATWVATEAPGATWRAASAVLEDLQLDRDSSAILKMASVVAERHTA